MSCCEVRQRPALGNQPFEQRRWFPEPGVFSGEGANAVFAGQAAGEAKQRCGVRSHKAELRAAELNPRHPVVQNELGIVHRRQGRFEEARARYERALEIYGDFHFARKNLGIVCELFLRDLDCAVESYRAYLDSVPGDEEVVMWVALLEQQRPTEVGR